MIIREAENNDLSYLVSLGEEFYSQTILDQYAPYDHDSSRRILEYLMSQETAKVFVGEVSGKIVGMLCGLIVPLYWNSNVLVAQQLAWYVQPEYRGIRSLRLLDIYEEWAAKAGAQICFSGSKHDTAYEAMNKMLSRRSYSLLESVNIRRLDKCR